ncbi:formylmethanofuran dehydrogenase subunit C [Azospirillum sp. YIM B02556]|uniref:Formylmethanofuran dehydrogenase subunit C n=1 Tax=Azospirillum endophyticum TaxID=2800326 RepID=A0ABS1F066_9PROT|nr:formylmethanofuran dehydrogenase subunit C [Azospirillum endophyticum]MBK1836801.1 formylmethanofuran dehydrogenase subunit C [Azospirillum endophyticum]
MSGMTLTFRGKAGTMVDMSAILPERLAGRTVETVAGLPLPCGGGQSTVGDMFDLSAGDAAEGLLIRPIGAVLQRVGAGMTSGRILVDGDVGGHAGAGMGGGQLRIEGDAGEALGGALPGLPLGMRGGLISVGGSAGDRVAERMRRGIIVVDGAVGAFAAGFMVAGTLAAGRGCGPHPGFGMRRGTLLLGRPQDTAPDNFADGGTRDWLFLHLLRRALQGTGSWVERAGTTRAHRFIGDVAEGGHGEILAMA